MKTTRYFEEQVIRKRPYFRLDWIERTITSPLAVEVQEDGRLRYWSRIDLVDEEKSYILRVVTLEDGTTVHNAFFDRNFREGEQ